MSFREPHSRGPCRGFYTSERALGRRRESTGRPAPSPNTLLSIERMCERRFRPRGAGQRYCSAECGQAARRWSRWKAQQTYRVTQAGKDKRNGQSRRYRERVKMRQPAAPAEAVAEPARVITAKFFRPLL